MANSAETTPSNVQSETAEVNVAKWGDNALPITDDKMTEVVPLQAQISDASTGLKAIQKFQKGWQGEATERRDSLKQLESESRGKLYARLGMAWEVIQELVKLPDDDLDELLVVHGLEPVKPGFNEFGPLNTMLWGEWKAIKPEDENKEKWASHATKYESGTMYWFKGNRSAEKYAKVMRYASQQELTPHGLIEKLTKNTMDKVLAADTQANSKTDKEVLDLEKYRAAVLARPTNVTVSRNACGVDKKYGEKVVALWGRFNQNGDIEIMGHYPASVKAINGHIDKVALKDGKDLLIEQLEAAQSAAGTGNQAASAE